MVFYAIKNINKCFLVEPEIFNKTRSNIFININKLVLKQFVAYLLSLRLKISELSLTNFR